MISLPVVLLLIFLVCGLVYARANKALVELEKQRLDKLPRLPGDDMHGTATELAKRFGLKLAPSGPELKEFCERNGLASEYQRHTRMLYSAIAVALACAFIIVKMSPAKPNP